MVGSAPLEPQLFLIKAASSEPEKPENENYLVRTQLNNGHWAPFPRGLRGTGEVQWFLRSNRVDANRIDLAIEELSRTGRTMVSTG